MKQLQNNYTTPEQSKKLLDLGVPVLTADCYFYIKEVNGRNICDTPNLVPYGMGEYGLKRWWTERNNARYTPCWSVGRLLELVNICMYDIDKRDKFYTKLYYHQDDLISFILLTLQYNEVDFSKLEY